MGQPAHGAASSWGSRLMGQLAHGAASSWGSSEEAVREQRGSNQGAAGEQLGSTGVQ